MTRSTQALKSPLFHFVVLGTLLFVAEAAFDRGEPVVASAPPAVRTPIVLTADRVRALESDFRATYGAAPTPAQRRALVEQAVQDEMLYREARVLALGLEDGSVRRRLLEKMRALNEGSDASEEMLVENAIALGLDDDLVIRRLLATKMRLVLQQNSAESPVGDDEVRAWIDRHRDELMQPATLTLSHVFFADEPGRGNEAEAAAMREEIRRGDRTSEQALAASDPFPLGPSLRAYAQPQVQGRFGKPFAETVFALPQGEWSGPIRSPFGVHLVRVEEKVAPALPPLEALRPRAMRAVVAERAQQHLATGLAQLRTLYEVRVEETASPAKG